MKLQLNRRSVQKNNGFAKFSFVLKIIRIRDSQQKKKKKKEEDRNNDKKMMQIRVFLYQLYSIYKIQNNKLLKNS